MKSIGILTLIFFAFVGSAMSTANGGVNCAACTMLVGLAEQLSQVHAIDTVTAVEKFVCPNLPGTLIIVCKLLLLRYGSAIRHGNRNKATPDIICHHIGFCRQDPGSEFCHLFPLPSSYKVIVNRMKALKETRGVISSKDDRHISICSIPGVSMICKIFDRFSKDHLPTEDRDKDRFSLKPTMRGSHWRGKDCNDKKKDIYPGRKPLNLDTEFDSNCNGIHGTNSSSGKNYEEMLCSGTGQRGVAILGDSAGAHFHIPAEYFMVESYTKNTFKDLLMILTDEFDWPQLSSITAYTSNKWPNSIHGPVDSLYMRMKKDNLCNHRDYQNIAVNGANSKNMQNIMHGLSRNKTADNPLIVVLALVGNDVCNIYPDTISHMTTEAEYRSNIMATLNYLNSTLPNGSKVIITGLADGRVLWDTMSDRLHPIGQLNSDVRFKDLYAFSNCLQVSPCVGWLNSNGTLRDITSQRAADLTAQAKNIAETERFAQFEMAYIAYDVGKIMEEWRSRGGQDWEVIEPVDGFHPGQIGQALTAEYIHDTLASKYPDFIGKVNPNNAKIADIFGDQGGY